MHRGGLSGQAGQAIIYGMCGCISHSFYLFFIMQTTKYPYVNFVQYMCLELKLDKLLMLLHVHKEVMDKIKLKDVANEIQNI